jgi:hypothetical protein
MKGCIAYYDGTELLLSDMPIYKKEKGHDLDIHQLFSIIKELAPEHCFLEKTTAMPGISGKAAYSMGKSEGAIVACLVGLGIVYTLVRPTEWKKAIDCPADKGLARQRASQLFPAFAHNWDRKKDDGRAEAALIALYGFRRFY